MVEDISFPRNLPKVTRTDRVKRVARQDRENKDKTFQKYLDQNEDQQKDGENGQDPEKSKEKVKPMHAGHENATAPAVDPSNESENDSQGKRIDVHA